MNILLLEDDSTVTTVLRLILQTRGYAISETKTAQQAIEACCVPNRRYDLLIADVVLPVSSGIEVAVKLRVWVPNLKTILTSDVSVDCFTPQQAVLFNQMASDSVRFLLKPFSLTDVLDTVDSFELSGAESPRVASAAHAFPFSKVVGQTESQKRKIEIFSAGCSCCEDLITGIRTSAGPSCEIIVLDMREPGVAKRAKELGVRFVPAVAINGELAGYGSGGGPDLATLQSAGLGVPLS